MPPALYPAGWMAQRERAHLGGVPDSPSFSLARTCCLGHLLRPEGGCSVAQAAEVTFSWSHNPMRHLWPSEGLTRFPDHKPLQEARPGTTSAENRAPRADGEQETRGLQRPPIKARCEARGMKTAWTAACRPSRKGRLLLRSGGGSKSLEKRSNITRFSSFSKDASHSLFYIKVSKFLKPALKKGLCAGSSYQGCGPEPARGPPTAGSLGRLVQGAV